MPNEGRRVLMVLENNPYVRDRRVKLEAKALTEAGFSVTVIAPRAPSEEGVDHEYDGVRVISYPAPREGQGPWGFAWEYAVSLCMALVFSLRVWLRDDFDILHAHNPPDLYFLLGMLFKLLGKRFVFDHHDLAPELYLHRFHRAPDLGYRLLNLLRRWSCAVADRVIVVNESCRRACVERSKARDAKIHTVRNGPDTRRFHRVAPDPQLRRDGDFLLGYVGILGPQDGVDWLLRALRVLVHDRGRPQVRCVLLGSGESLDALVQLSIELDVADHVEFLGWIGDDARLVQILSSVDACVVPDPSNPMNDMCTMIKVLEYMSLGQPIVAFDLPETRFSAGDAALYAGHNDEELLARRIEQLMDDPALRARCGEEGVRRIRERFDWRYSARALLEMYEGLVRS